MLQNNLFWRKFSPEKRCFFIALITALAVHGLLLVLFRATPQSGNSINSNSATAGRIDLSDPANSRLAQWIKNHDPALMTAPDRQSGYSAALSKFPARAELEDLPLPLHLSVPRQLESAPLPENITGRSHLLSSQLSLQLAVSKKSVPDLQICYNGRPNEKLQKIFDNMPGRQQLAKVGISQLQTLSVKIVPPRLPGLENRLQLQQSSGSYELDRLVLQTLRGALLQKIIAQGEITLSVPGQLPAGKSQKGNAQ